MGIFVWTSLSSRCSSIRLAETLRTVMPQPMSVPTGPGGGWGLLADHPLRQPPSGGGGRCLLPGRGLSSVPSGDPLRACAGCKAVGAVPDAPAAGDFGVDQFIQPLQLHSFGSVLYCGGNPSKGVDCYAKYSSNHKTLRTVMPQPMSVPTRPGATRSRRVIVVPTAHPWPACTSGMMRMALPSEQRPPLCIPHGAGPPPLSAAHPKRQSPAEHRA